MASLIHYRMLGYVVTLLLHGGNMLILGQKPSSETSDDPRIRVFGQLQNRYFTCWTFFLQMLFAVTGLVCDLFTLANSSHKDYRLPKYLKGFRDTMFAAVVWPSTLLVFTFFWSVYLYDRSLVFPEFLDKVLSPISNHIMHTAILPIVLWELICQPRVAPKTHTRYLAHLVFHMALYLSVLTYTYIERDTWIYPILTNAYGTINFPIILSSILLSTLFWYYTQWFVTYLRWGSAEKPKEKQR